MSKLSIWANLCPRKLFWELRQLDDTPASIKPWWKQTQILYKCLKLLKNIGIDGLRLNIFNLELTSDGKRIHWNRLEKILEMTSKLGLKIDYCLGPFQYPQWPGIRLPEKILSYCDGRLTLDEVDVIKEFGLKFLALQLNRLGNDKRISSFYLGNEWPNRQEIEGTKGKYISISKDFMLKSAELYKNVTNKPIIMNTNIDAGETKKLIEVFSPFIDLLRSQLWIGLDIYPSRENLLHHPKIWWHRKRGNYMSSIGRLKDELTKNLLFSEVEAQPWGKGESWVEYFKLKMETYTKKDFKNTMNNIIIPSGLEKTTLWGAEFWLLSHFLGFNWPLRIINELTST